MNDIGHSYEEWKLTELQHDYGNNVHILNDPYYGSLLGRLCSADTHQPTFNQLIRKLYEGLCRAVVNNEFPRRTRRLRTRMAATTDRAVVGADFIDPDTPVISVDIARAGILPSNTCFDLLNNLLDPKVVRQDHLIMQRTTNEAGEVIGAEMSGSKIGGPVEGRVVLLPDPMGATGSSLCQAINYYKTQLQGSPGPIIAMHLIITPQYIRTVKATHPDVAIYALRLDRGMSSDEVLAARPGSRWDEESGLNAVDYIVPGGGGFGELMNNALV